MKKSIRYIAAVLSLAMVFTLLQSFVPRTGEDSAAEGQSWGIAEVYAADVIEVSDVETLKKELAKDGSVSIKLTKDIDKEYSNDEWEKNYKDVWITIGKGEKSLDLNGKDIEIDVNNCYNRRPYLFKVPSGATFIINDTAGGGNIHFDGYIYAAGSGTAGLHKANLEHNQVRNGFWVDGGTLYFNGGTLEGGRSKEQYVGFGLAASFYGSNLDDWFYGSGRYDGNVRQQIGCNGIYMTSGSTIINGGTIEGRGYQELKFSLERVSVDVIGYMDNKEWWEYDIDISPSAGIKATGGSLLINNGSIWGYGNANCLSIAQDVSVSVKAGTFQCHHLGKLVVPGPIIKGKLDRDKYPVLIFDGDNNGQDSHARYGNIGLKYEWIDRDKADVYVAGEKKNPETWEGTIAHSKTSSFYDHKYHYKTEVKARDDLKVPVYDASTNTEVTDYISWDMQGDGLYYIPIESRYWNNFAPNKGPYYNGYLGISKDMGVSSSVSIGYGGKEQAKISSGGEIGETVNELLIQGNNYWNHYTDNSGKATVQNPTRMYFKLSEIVPSDAKLGDTFKLSIESAQFIMGNDYYPAGTLKNRKVVEVRLEQLNPVITQQPTSDHLYSGNIHKVAAKGDTVTMTAAADFATGAYWKRTYPNDDKTFAGTFDAETGVATLADYPVMATNDLVCIFTNEHGETATDKIRVFYQPTKADNSEYEELTWYTSRDKGVIIPEGIDDFSADQLYNPCWYYCPEDKDPKNDSNWDVLDGAWDSSVHGKQCRFYYNGKKMLWMVSPQPSNNGYYKYITMITEDGSAWRYISPIYHLTVKEGNDPEKDVTNVTVLGLDNRYYGDDVPSIDDIVVDDDDRGVVYIKSYEWTAGVKDGKFKTGEGTPTLKLKLALPVEKSYYFSNNLDTGEYFTCYYPGDKFIYNVTAYGLKEVEVTIRLSYMRLPADKVIFNPTYITLNKGDEVDIQLSDMLEFYCNERHIAAGTEHQVTSYYIKPDFQGILNGLGLTLESSGRLHGVANGNPSDGWRPVTIYCGTSPAQDSDPSYMIYFFVNPTKNTTKLPIPSDFLKLMHQHTWGAWKDKGDGYHVHTCDDCGSEESVSHFWDDGVVTKAATGSAAGVMTYTCADCGATKTEPIEKHTIIHVDEVASTCVSAGVQAHYECSDCGMAFTDAAGTKQIEDTSTIALPLADHDWGEWVVTKTATATEAGERTRTCKNDPSHTETEAIPAGGFPDVPKESNIYKPVTWAVKAGIIKGFSDGSFKPEESCTREQFAIMMWRMAGKPDADESASNRFTDIADFSNATSRKAVGWAVGEGIIKGFDDGSFGPLETVTRRQVVIMLWRWAGRPSASASAGFSDVSAGESTYASIQWGAEAGVVKGYNDGTFRPEDPCERQHIVIFLYRYTRDVLEESVN